MEYVQENSFLQETEVETKLDEIKMDMLSN